MASPCSSAAWIFLVCLSECQCFLSFDWCLLLRLNGCKDIVAEFSTSLFLSRSFGVLRALFSHRYSSDNKTISIYNLNFAIAVFRRSWKVKSSSHFEAPLKPLSTYENFLSSYFETCMQAWRLTGGWKCTHDRLFFSLISIFCTVTPQHPLSVPCIISFLLLRIL